MKEKPKVSVICITYGHEDYIAQALDSFLMQKTNFPFQILVGEDKGPDRTAEIVLSYAEKYPDKIIPFIREENMGAQRNLIDLCSRAGTEYLAFCEGDDYWTDEYKLQKQFDLMEAHPEYRACVHATEIDFEYDWSLKDDYEADENGRIILPFSKRTFSYEEDVIDGHITMDRYLNSTPFHTSSYFYRWNYDLQIPEWYYKHFAGDHSLMMMQVGDGLCGVIPDIMSVYRRSDVGVYFHDSYLEHYYSVGLAWSMLLMDLRDYFEENYGPTFCREIFDKRISNISFTYFECASKLDRLGEVFSEKNTDGLLARKKELFGIYCDSAKKYKSVYQRMEGKYTEKGIKYMLSSKNNIKEAVDAELESKRNRKLKNIEDQIATFFAEESKSRDPFTWVFVGDEKTHFTGNVRHLYEYVIALHPEIKPVWIVKRKKALKFFEAEELPVAVAGTDECRELLDRASVAVINQYKTNTLNIAGFNKNIGIVRLGEGASLTDFSKDKGTLSDPQRNPKASIEQVKAELAENYEGINITKENLRYFVEDYADTFLQIAPNEKSAEIYEKAFGIPKDNIMLCGSPSSFAVTDKRTDKRKSILMVPGKRYRYGEKKQLFSAFTDNINEINDFLTDNDYSMTIYLDNSYTPDNIKALANRMQEFNRINVVGYWQDIYQSFDCFDVIISDWSEIMYDFILKDKPAVIFAPVPEGEDCKEKIFDFEQALPGKRAYSWNEAFEMAVERIADPSTDREMRTAAKEMIFDMTVNDENNSERIVAEIKRRLGIQ